MSKSNQTKIDFQLSEVIFIWQYITNTQDLYFILAFCFISINRSSSHL